VSDLISRSDAIALADGAGYLSIEALQSIPALIEATAERDALRERVARLELALSYIAAEANRSNSNIVHIKRIIAAQTRAALQEDTPND
jgi:hypothetical protein